MATETETEAATETETEGKQLNRQLPFALTSVSRTRNTRARLTSQPSNAATKLM